MGTSFTILKSTCCPTSLMYIPISHAPYCSTAITSFLPHAKRQEETAMREHSTRGKVRWMAKKPRRLLSSILKQKNLTLYPMGVSNCISRQTLPTPFINTGVGNVCRDMQFDTPI